RDRARRLGWDSAAFTRSAQTAFGKLLTAVSALNAIRCDSSAAWSGCSVERHALQAADRRFFRTHGAGVNADPRNLRGQPAIFDLGATVHDDLHAIRFGKGRGLVVANTELHPNHLRPRLER